jgi:hypothetical protein
LPFYIITSIEHAPCHISQINRCRGQPRGSPKTNRGILLKTCKKPKQDISHLNTHPRNGPHRGGPHGPSEWPSRGLSRAGSASLEGLRLPRAGSAPLEGPRLPRAGSAPLEGSSPPRSRPRHEHVRSRTRVRAFNVLTRWGGAIIRLGIMPRPCCTNSLGEPIPATVGDCATWPVSAP